MGAFYGMKILFELAIVFDSFGTIRSVECLVDQPPLWMISTGQGSRFTCEPTCRHFLSLL